MPELPHILELNRLTGKLEPREGDRELPNELGLVDPTIPSRIDPLAKELMYRYDNYDLFKQGFYPDVEHDPEGAMNLAFEKLRTQMPRETSAARIRPMGLLDKVMTLGNALAVTLPNGTIAYDTGSVRPSMTANENLLKHELTHVKQDLDTGGLLRRWLSRVISSKDKYQNRNAEIEAFKAMNSVEPLGDIELEPDYKRSTK